MMTAEDLHGGCCPVPATHDLDDLDVRDGGYFSVLLARNGRTVTPATGGSSTRASVGC